MGIGKFFEWLDNRHWVVKTLTVLFFLYFFLLGMAFLGAGFKMFGANFADKILAGGAGSTNAHPILTALICLFIGLLTTSLIQSSSTTTSLVVGLVAANSLGMEYAIPMVMGANLGTTVTNTLVSLGHITRPDEFRRAFSIATVHDFFNLLTIIVLLPIELSTHFLQKSAMWLTNLVSNLLPKMEGGMPFPSPVKATTKPVVHWVQELAVQLLGWEEKGTGMKILFVVIAMLCIFFALLGLTKVLKMLMQGRVESALDRVLARSGYLAMLVGVVVTATVQSSSVTTSVLVPLVGAGLIGLAQAFPITLGANVGTTVTAIIASTAGDISGLTIALVHLLFNICGIIIFYPIRFMRNIPLWLATNTAEIVTKRRYLAIVFIVVFFYLIPGLAILSYQWAVH